MIHALAHAHGPTFVVRPPVPATLNKAGANYKSEVTHREYSPRQAYDEWLGVCEGIVEFGGDAIFDFEAADDVFLDREALFVDETGAIMDRPAGSRLGHLDTVETGRVFSANGPWVIVDGGKLSALLPNMLSHRRSETTYYRRLLERTGSICGLQVELFDNPHPWEGMADVAIVSDRVVLTYTVRGHYDEGLPAKTMRSSREGVLHAARFAKIPESACILAELVYPHFHGDTVHFGIRTPDGQHRLCQYPGGLFRGQAAGVAAALPAGAVLPIDRTDAVDAYAGNSRQVLGGVLVPDGVSGGFTEALERLGLRTKRLPLFELFGKAGGGPACATLYLPDNLPLPKDAPIRYSVRRDEARKRRTRIPERLTVSEAFFRDKTRG